MLRTVFSVVVALCLAFVAAGKDNIQVGITPSGSEYAKGHVLVGFAAGARGPVVQEGAPLFGGTVAAVLPELSAALIVYPVETDIFAAIRQIGMYPGVRYAEPDFIRHATFTPNDPSWGSQWGPQKIGCTTAWNFGTGDTGTVIAIVDTGINYNHPDLTGKVILGYDYVNNDNDPMDDNGHGTHCAGISAANTNNGVGIAGVGYNCKLMAVKVMDASGSGSDSNVALGMDYATANGAKVISMSLGGSDPSSTMEAAVNNAWTSGVVVCAAAGNSNSSALFYPAAYDNCIAVGATDSLDSKADFSNYGSTWVDVAAPGVNIYSCYGSGYGNLSGTSMACPHVAGEAGLLYSKVTSNRSLGAATAVRNYIESNAVNVGGWVAKGRINVGAALAAAANGGLETAYAPTSFTVVMGGLMAGDVTCLAAIDGIYLFLQSTAGAGIKICDWYTEYDVAAGTYTGGKIDFTGYSTRAGTIIGMQVYNWTTSTWTTVLSGDTLATTKKSWTVPFPSGISNYISSSRKVRVRATNSLSTSFQARTDLFRIRLNQ